MSPQKLQESEKNVYEEQVRFMTAVAKIEEDSSPSEEREEIASLLGWSIEEVIRAERYITSVRFDKIEKRYWDQIEKRRKKDLRMKSGK